MSKMKKVLIITYYWPPAGGPGVQRVLKFAKYLPEFGWQPIILTVKNGEYPAIDESLIKEIPKECIVYKTKTFEPYNLYKKFVGKKKDEKLPTHILNTNKNDNLNNKIAKWIRANLFIPDARIGWISHIVREGMKIIENEKPDIIFSSSPPHSLQIGAKKLAKKSGLKWVADFRDPWTDYFGIKDLSHTKITKKLNLNLEKSCLENADKIVSVSKSFNDLFKKKIKNNYFIIPNGFDAIDFQNISKEKNNKFKITYIGSIRKSQNPEMFFASLSKLKSEVLDKIEINFYGSTFPSVISTIKKYKFVDKIKLHKYISHKNIPKILINSNMLLLIIPNTSNNEGILPGKLFEYLATENYILGIGPKDGDASEILKKTNCGKMYNYDENLSQIILEQFKNWGNGKKQNVNNEAIKQYTRKKLTEKLVNIFEKLV